MKDKKKTIKKAVKILLLIIIVWFISNRTDNVFEEMYYSGYCSFKKGVSYTLYENVEGMEYYGECNAEDIGPIHRSYTLQLKELEDMWIDLYKDEAIEFYDYLKDGTYTLRFRYHYDLESKTLYSAVYMTKDDPHELIKLEEDEFQKFLPKFLEEQGMPVMSAEELRDSVLEEIIYKWTEGNWFSKYSKDDWGEYEIVYGSWYDYVNKEHTDE